MARSPGVAVGSVVEKRSRGRPGSMVGSVDEASIVSKSRYGTTWARPLSGALSVSGLPKASGTLFLQRHESLEEKGMNTWKRTVGARPTLILEEREDRGLQVYARWWCPVTQAWRRRATGLTVRPALGADVDPTLEMEAVAVGVRLYAEVQAAGASAAATRATIREVLDTYLESETEGLSHRYRQDLRRAAALIEEALGVSTPWARVTTAKVAEIWRGLAQRSSDGRGRRWAVRVAEVAWRVGAWAELQGLAVAGGGLRPPHGWRGLVARDFRRLAGVEPQEPARPRYSHAELRMLWDVLDQADPRLRLAVVGLGGGELRLGQVARTRRSNLDLTLGRGVHGLGTVRVLGRGRKQGVEVSLDAPARRAVEEALVEGFLSILEGAYREGAIDDYPLVPGGPMSDGKVPLAPASTRPISPSTLRRMYRAWERMAGVPTKEGRGWHAYRRAAVDAAVDLHGDPEVLARVGAWSAHSDVRARIYRARSDERVAVEAEKVRARLRASFQGADDGPTRPAGTSAHPPLHTDQRTKTSKGH